MVLTASELASLAADLDRGLSLPAAWYTEPAIAALEQERIFRHAWQYVGRAAVVATQNPSGAPSRSRATTPISGAASTSDARSSHQRGSALWAV